MTVDEIIPLCPHCGNDFQDSSPPAQGVRICLTFTDRQGQEGVLPFDVAWRFNPQPEGPDKIPHTGAVLAFEHCMRVIKLIGKGKAAVDSAVAAAKRSLVLPKGVLNPHSDSYKKLMRRGK